MNSGLVQLTDNPTFSEAAPMDDDLRAQVVDAISTVYDPEIPLNIYELGLIYGIDLLDEASVRIRMTLTAPGCPVADSLVAEVEARVRELPGVSEARVELVWDPPWSADLMSEAAKLTLNI